MNRQKPVYLTSSLFPAIALHSHYACKRGEKIFGEGVKKMSGSPQQQETHETLC